MLLTSAGLDGITTLPDHGADGAAEHVYNRVSSDIRIVEDSVETNT